MCVLFLLCAFGSAHAAKTIALESTSTVFTAYSGGTGSAQLMLVNCGTETLNYSLEANSSFLEYAPKGSASSWVDLSLNHDGELVFTNQPDEVSSAIELPFGFPFYNGVYTRVFIGENGGVALGASGEIGPDCEAFPTANAPALFVAPYWGDLEYRADQSHIYYRAESTRLIVTYDRMRNNDYEGDWQTFQVILHNDGGISFNYQDVAGYNGTVRGFQCRDTGDEMSWWGGSQFFRPDYYTVDTDISYSWDSSSGTEIVLHSPKPGSGIYTVEWAGCSDLIDIGFDFPFFGEVYSDFCVDVDGFIELGHTNEYWLKPHIPSSSPHALIVPFGSEFFEMVEDPRESRISYKRLSDSLIITYKDILYDASYTDGFQTYQVVLKNTGDIIFRFQMLEYTWAPVRFAPGIQDAVSRVCYVADLRTNLSWSGKAVQYVYHGKEWLSVSPEQGVVSANSFRTVNIKGDCSDLSAGKVYEAQLFVTHNASNYDSPISHPVAMHVLQSSGASLSVDSVRYEPVDCFRDDRIGPGDTVELYVALENRGSTDAVGVTAKLKNATHFSISNKTQGYGGVSAYEVVENEQPYVINVSSGCPAGLHNLTLEIGADPSKTWSRTVQVLVEPTPIPVFFPDHLMLFANEGGSSTVSLIISNSGGGPLDFLIDDSIVPTNYVWQANTNGAVTYSWVTFSAYSGWKPVVFNAPYSSYGDAVSEPVDIGFRFPFWGEDYEQVILHEDGMLSFFPSTNALWTGLRWDTIPGPLIAGYRPPNAGFLEPDENASIKANNTAFDGKFIISYENMNEGRDDSRDQTFQIVLEPDGTITYQYKTLTGRNWDSARIGVKSAEGVYDTASLIRDGDYITVTNTTWPYAVWSDYRTNIEERVIQFKPDFIDWILPYSSTLSTLQPQETRTLNFTCTAADLSAGVYDAILLFTYQEGVVEVPVTFYISQ